MKLKKHYNTLVQQSGRPIESNLPLLSPIEDGNLAQLRDRRLARILSQQQAVEMWKNNDMLVDWKQKGGECGTPSVQTTVASTTTTTTTKMDGITPPKKEKEKAISKGVLRGIIKDSPTEERQPKQQNVQMKMNKVGKPQNQRTIQKSQAEKEVKVNAFNAENKTDVVEREINDFFSYDFGLQTQFSASGNPYSLTSNDNANGNNQSKGNSNHKDDDVFNSNVLNYHSPTSTKSLLSLSLLVLDRPTPVMMTVRADKLVREVIKEGLEWVWERPVQMEEVQKYALRVDGNENWVMEGQQTLESYGVTNNAVLKGE